MNQKVGILHPGEMGSFVATTVVLTLGEAWWCSVGRSEASHERARQAGLNDLGDLQALCEHCDILISVCPPAVALEQAQAVIDCSFRGVYCDANAVSPALMEQMQSRLTEAGIRLVDGGIIGLPSPEGKATLYLSGDDASELVECFAAGPLQASVLGKQIGQASALKQCYAAWNKGRTALLGVVLAAAEQLQVRLALEARWESEEAGVAQSNHKRLQFVARKAWRFGPEMDEIAATLRSCGLPGEFFDAAAQLYRRESAFKGSSTEPELSSILEALLKAE